MLKKFTLMAIFLVALAGCSRQKDLKVVELEFDGQTIGEYICKENEFKITSSSAGKPFNSFEFDRWYKESEFIQKFKQAGSTSTDAQSAFASVKGLRTASCSKD